MVSVSVFVTVVTVKWRSLLLLYQCAKNLEYTRCPFYNVQTDTSLSWTTHTNGDPLSSNNFSNLDNSPSPTPELQYTRDGTSEYMHSKYACALEVYTLKQIRVWIEKYTIQGKARKKTRHAYVLVWKYLITWSCSGDHQQGPACGWDTRVWAIGTRWWVHHVLDPARREESLGYREESPHRRLLLKNCVGVCFLARSICTTNFNHSILIRRSQFSVFSMSVFVVIQVISYKIDVKNYMCNFPGCISSKLVVRTHLCYVHNGFFKLFCHVTQIHVIT